MVGEGALGKYAFGESTYHAGDPFLRMYDAWKSDPENPEVRLRAWGLDKVLSGDIITEQNIHTLDVMNWIMGQEPLYAEGTGGRTVRPVGTCWDHFVLHFRYPDDVGIAFSSRQFEGHGTQPEGIRNRMFGAKGVLETEYGGQVLIRGGGSYLYRGGRSPGIYKDGTAANIATFHADILSGNVRQSDRRTERPQQPHHDPRPQRRLQRQSRLLERSGRQRRAARDEFAGVEELKPLLPGTCFGKRRRNAECAEGSTSA